MRLPVAERAIIDAAKIRDYLLSPLHPVGRFKATFFGGIGYSRDDWERLARDIRAIVNVEEATPRESSRFGQKYEVRGTLVGPSGFQARVVTVWIILNGEHAPRFVTAFPE